jgi:hypothetical protein
MFRSRASKLRHTTAALALSAFCALTVLPAGAQADTAELSLSTAQLSFPTTTVGNPGNPGDQRQVSAKNSGDVPVSINSVFIDGTDPSDFNQNGNCGGQLDPGQSCNIDVNFSPSGLGTRDATLHVSSDEPRGDQTVDLTGVGAAPDLTFEPASYDFGLQSVNSGSSQTNLQLRNTGAASVQVNSVDIIGSGSNAFWTGFSSCFGTTLQPNDTCTVQVNFGPNDAVPFAAQLRATTNGISFTADLSGQGGRANVTGSPNPADFGSATTGQQGATRTITMTNNGNLPGGFFVAVISGGDVASFRLVHENCTGTPLDPSASCTAQVRFQPDSSGPKVAQLSFFGDQDGGAQVNLTGVGIDPQGSLTPGGHDFGRQDRDSTSSAQDFVLSNDGGTPLRLSGASVVGADADQFRLSSDDCTDVTLPIGGRCAVQVRFAPDSKGSKAARLRVTGEGGSITASLAGTGVTPGSSGVSFRWRGALHPHGANLVAGKAACHGSTGCRVSARALVLGALHRGTRVRTVAVKLPAIRMTIGAGATRALRLRLTQAALLAARGGGRLELKLKWRADGHPGRTRSNRRLGF